MLPQNCFVLDRPKSWIVINWKDRFMHTFLFLKYVEFDVLYSAKVKVNLFSTIKATTVEKSDA